MLLFLTLLQILCISWLGSGTRIEFLAPMVAVSALMFLCASFQKNVPKTLFFKTLSISLCLVAIMSLIAYFNPFCEMIRGEYFSTFKRIDYIKFLPTSISAEFNDGNALRSLAEIAASISVCLSCMVLFKKRLNMKIVLAFLALNIAVMGAFGIWQKCNKLPTMYNFIHCASDFFGSFFLSSAAGAFFNLGIAISIALIFLIDKSSLFGKLTTVAFAVCVVVCIVATYYTGSIGAQLLTFATFGALPFMLLLRLALVRFGLKWAMTAGGFIFVALMCIAVIFKPEIEHRLTFVDGHKNPIGVSATSRMEMYKLTKNIISEYPIFGCGGQCSQYLLSIEMTKNTPKSQMARTTYHVHSDIIEYIAEYGIIGLITILACLFAWLSDFVKSRPTYARTVLFLGCLISIAHSCVDMNLHIPSTMIALAIVCAATVSTRNKKREKGVIR